MIGNVLTVQHGLSRSKFVKQALPKRLIKHTNTSDTAHLSIFVYSMNIVAWQPGTWQGRARSEDPRLTNFLIKNNARANLPNFSVCAAYRYSRDIWERGRGWGRLETSPGVRQCQKGRPVCDHQALVQSACAGRSRAGAAGVPGKTRPHLCGPLARALAGH